jgi:cyclic pyranopterin phosphate synthase
MPEENYVWLPKASLLSYEELSRLAGIFLAQGASKIRLTGGEPLLRHDLPDLVGMLRRHSGLEDLALTTNGILLAKHARSLKQAGLDRVTVSLDTLRPDRLAWFARSGRHEDILSGIREAREAGLGPVKLNSVVVRGYNEDEIPALLEFARGEGAELRFIEYMDVGGATRWAMSDVVTRAEILADIAARFGAVEPLVVPAAQGVGPAGGDAAAPAERFRLSDGTVFGIIASTTAPFCRSCDRSRVTADGTWYLCLYADRGVDLREPLRSGASDREVGELIQRTWKERTDRGAERRMEEAQRGALYRLEGLRADPRREMHTRGG